MLWLGIALLILSCAACIFANALRKAREDNPYHTGEAYDPFGYEFGDIPHCQITIHNGETRP